MTHGLKRYALSRIINVAKDGYDHTVMPHFAGEFIKAEDYDALLQQLQEYIQSLREIGGPVHWAIAAKLEAILNREQEKQP